MDVDHLFAGITLPDKWRVLEEWDEYMRMVERVEALPENRSGADKSSVERGARSFRDHYDRIQRSR